MTNEQAKQTRGTKMKHKQYKTKNELQIAKNTICKGNAKDTYKTTRTTHRNKNG